MSLATISIQLVLQAARPEMTRRLNTDRDQDQAGGWEKRRNKQRPRRNTQRGHREATEHKKPGRQPGRVVWGGGGGAKMHPVQWGGRPGCRLSPTGGHWRCGWAPAMEWEEGLKARLEWFQRNRRRGVSLQRGAGNGGEQPGRWDHDRFE